MQNAKYNNAKIYKISSDNSENIYIGSTFQLLCKRLSEHKSSYKRYLENKCNYISSFAIIKDSFYDLQNPERKLSKVQIELIEEYNCNNKKELHLRERYYIELYKSICVNKIVPTRTQKEYHNDNLQSINQVKNKKFICKHCNGGYTHTNRTHHFKSLKHRTLCTGGGFNPP